VDRADSRNGPSGIDSTRTSAPWTSTSRSQSFGYQGTRLRDDRRQDVERFAGEEQRENTADESIQQRQQDHRHLGDRAERDKQQNEDEPDGKGNRDRQRFERALLLLELSAEVESGFR
jgi:hypothetical protein